MLLCREALIQVRMSPLESTAETRAVNNDIDAKRELDLDTSLPSSVLRWTFQLVSAPVNLVLVPTMTWLRWVPSSKGQLQQAEQRVLACEFILVHIIRSFFITVLLLLLRQPFLFSV